MLLNLNDFSVSIFFYVKRVEERNKTLKSPFRKSEIQLNHLAFPCTVTFSRHVKPVSCSFHVYVYLSILIDNILLVETSGTFSSSLMQHVCACSFPSDVSRCRINAGCAIFIPPHPEGWVDESNE